MTFIQEYVELMKKYEHCWRAYSVRHQDKACEWIDGSNISHIAQTPTQLEDQLLRYERTFD